MKVGFYSSGGGDVNMVLADQMIRSVKKAMPGVEIVQFSDMEGEQIWGVDDIYRLPNEPMTIVTAKHYAMLEGDWLTLDTDMIVQKDVRHIFNEPFDVAFASREGTYLNEGEEESKFMKSMPHNIGMTFTRCPAFWREVVRRLYAKPESAQKWMGNQIVAAEIYRENIFNVKILPSAYNFPPRFQEEDVSDKYIVHYKGRARKIWMLGRFNE